MKALVFNAPRDVRYEDYPDPVLKTPNSAVLKVKSCSICGSDLHIYHGDQIGKTDYEGHVQKFCVGHEFIGEVVETGPDVHTVRAGVAPVPRLWDGLIPLLQHGRLKAEGLFSHHMNLADGAEAYQLFDSREDGVVKIMIQVDG